MKLLPCPFCGDIPTAGRTYSGYWCGCINLRCDLSPNTKSHATRKLAIAAWNKRTPAQPEKE